MSARWLSQPSGPSLYAHLWIDGEMRPVCGRREAHRGPEGTLAARPLRKCENCMKKAVREEIAPEPERRVS